MGPLFDNSVKLCLSVNRDLKSGYNMRIVKIRAFCGQKFKNQIFHGAVKDFGI